MKEHWPRAASVIELDAADVGRLVLPLFPGHAIVGIDHVEGGLINTNLKLRVSGRQRALLLRIYQRGAAAAQKEMMIERVLGGRVPVPQFLYFCAQSPIAGHPYAILDWIDGPELQASFGTLTSERLGAIGRAIGLMLAIVHGVRFDRFGFLGADLTITEPIDLDRAALLGYLGQSFRAGPGDARLGAELTAALLRFVEREGGILDEWLSQPCLVHGDFNGSNILLDPDKDDAIAAVIDWEYALSATPAFDFGNLLRPPFDARPEFAAALAEGYRAAGGNLPKQWERIARLADMYAFAEILNRPTADAIVIADAKAAISKLIETWPGIT